MDLSQSGADHDSRMLVSYSMLDEISRSHRSRVSLIQSVSSRSHLRTTASNNQLYSIEYLELLRSDRVVRTNRSHNLTMLPSDSLDYFRRVFAWGDRDDPDGYGRWQHIYLHWTRLVRVNSCILLRLGIHGDTVPDVCEPPSCRDVTSLARGDRHDLS